MIWDIVDLPWLLPPPEDFRKQCNSIAPDSHSRVENIMRLASTALDTSQLSILSGTITKCRFEEAADPLVPFRLAILGSATTCAFVPSLTGAAARHAILLSTVQGSYDQFVQEAINPDSDINTSKPDAVLFALDARALNLHTFDKDIETAKTNVARALETISLMRQGIRDGCGAPIIFQTIPALPASIFGSLDILVAGTVREKIDEVNQTIRSLAEKSGDQLFDLEALASIIGLDRWHDPVKWNLYRLPFAQNLVPLYSDHLARLVSAIRGNSRKCLVLDLDNTIWGGVVGDDGIENLRLGEGDPVGEAYLDVQRYALALRDRGIALAVSSKNDAKIALEAFRTHPDMILKEEDIAVFQVNWQDKASNLEVIAKKLNIGVDALVFLDDNPAERAQVRGALPMVAVPELPEDVSYYSRVIAYSGYFESVDITEEDRQRANEYRANEARSELRLTKRDLTEYLKSLDMAISFRPFDSIGRSRITQLINKSNQFNLTTRRYTEIEIGDLEGDSDVSTLQVRLSDAFGDNGMISVIICRRVDKTTWEIDTWLMSCRVLGRCVEQAVLNELVACARKDKIETIIGRYISTAKNDLVKDHYNKLGFEESNSDDASTVWLLDVTKYEKKIIPISQAV